MNNVIIVGNVADDPFAVDVGHLCGQVEDFSDLISLKSFANEEFCPRFIVDDTDQTRVGRKLENVTVVIVSTCMGPHTRNGLAMRNFLIARAAKDNGARHVVLIEPDLYYSAQDRGPRPEHGVTEFPRDVRDYQKFDGQPFSARLYADLLKAAGVDEIVTVHNHSHSVKTLFMDRFSGRFHNLQPADLYAHYMRHSDIVDCANCVICAPDKGAVAFVNEVREQFPDGAPPQLIMDKVRDGERHVRIQAAERSPLQLDAIRGKDVVVIDDMVRTGSTIVECCRVLKEASPRRVVYFVTHFYSCSEGREKMNDPCIDEIVTTNTIPNILNRDMQGRLRRKMVVLKIERWISRFLLDLLGHPPAANRQFYAEDMSSKNPRWKGAMGPLFEATVF